MEWSLIRKSPFPYKDWLELDWLTTFLRDCGDLPECVFFEDVTSDAECKTIVKHRTDKKESMFAVILDTNLVNFVLQDHEGYPWNH